MLSIREGRLFVEEVAASDLVQRFGSPLYVYSESQLRLNVRRFAAAMASAWPEGPVDVLPAFKANPMIATRRVLTEEGAGADIYSPQELDGALRAGVEPSRISVNGGGKTRDHVRRCIDVGARITVEDVDEVDLIQEVAAELGTTAKIRLRVKLAMPNLWQPSDLTDPGVPTDLVVQVYKAGIPTEYLADLGRRALSMPNVELVGLHLHIGRHRPTAAFWAGQMQRYGRLIVELSRSWGGWVPQEIDCGGGFPSRRDPINHAGSPAKALLAAAGYPLLAGLRLLGESLYHRTVGAVLPDLLGGSGPTFPPPIEELVGAAVRALRAELDAGGMSTRGIRLQMEPGRHIYGNAAVHLARVKATKRQSEPFPYGWVLIDTTQFFLGTQEHNRYPVLAADRADGAQETVADVVGQSCFGDILVPQARLPLLERGVQLQRTSAPGRRPRPRRAGRRHPSCRDHRGRLGPGRGPAAASRVTRQVRPGETPPPGAPDEARSQCLLAAKIARSPDSTLGRTP